jgi:hypothetical protein
MVGDGLMRDRRLAINDAEADAGEDVEEDTEEDMVTNFQILL